MLQRNLITFAATSLLCAAALLNAGCASSIRTYRVNSSLTQKKARGVYYALPRTIVGVTVPVNLTELKPGNFCDLTPIFFPDIEPPAYGKSFKLGNVGSTNRGEPDPKQVFMVEITGHLLEDKKLSMSLSADGVMSKVDVTSTNNTGEFISQALKSSAAIASKLLVGSLAAAPETSKANAEEIKTAKASCPNLFPDEVNVYSALGDEDKKFYCSLSHRERLVYAGMQPYLRTAFREYVTTKPEPVCLDLAPEDLAKFDYKSHFLQAYSVYNEIVELRRQKGTIAGVTALVPNVSPDYLKLLTSRIEDPLQADLNQFFGTEVQKTWTATYEVDAPDLLGTTEQQAFLFAWTRQTGVCEATADKFELTAYSVQPPTPDFIARKCSGPIKYLTMGLAKGIFDGANGNQASDGIQASTLDKSGMFYRIPAKAVVQAYAGTFDGPAKPGAVKIPRPDRTQLAGTYYTRTSIAQIGKIVSLPESTGGRKTQYTMDLYADTGAIQNFAMTSDAVLDKSMISDAETGAGSISDALTARKKAAHTDKELEELKRQHAILDERVAIKTQQDALAAPAAPAPAAPKTDQ